MIRLAISVEGKTEGEFCNNLIKPHLENLGIYSDAIVIKTKRYLTGEKYAGGAVNIDRMKSDVSALLRSYHYVTTFYDFYGFEGKKPDESSDELIRRIFQACGSDNKFLPYIQMHEFEALLFSSPDAFNSITISSAIKGKIEAVVADFGNPEDINDSPQTAPSKRLKAIFGTQLPYDKAQYGPIIAKNIGLERMREKCPRFHNWLLQLEQLVTK
jgi:Domain of unknown function (DUF4276)